MSNNKITILWALNKKCNLGCRYCYFNHSPQKINNTNETINITEAVKFINSINNKKIKQISIAGGEPLLHTNTFEIFDALKKKNIRTTLSTNGTLLSEEMCNKVLLYDLDAVFISLDSVDFQYHDKWRGRHQDTITGIKNILNSRRLLKKKTIIGIYVVVTKENINQIISLLDYLISLGIDYFVWQAIWLPPDHVLRKQLFLNKHMKNQWKKMVEEILERKSQIILPNSGYIKIMDKYFSNSKTLVVKNCFAGSNLLFIDYSGNISGCPSALKTNDWNSKLNIKKNSFNDAYNTYSSRVVSCNKFSVDCSPMWELCNAKIFKND